MQLGLDLRRGPPTAGAKGATKGELGGAFWSRWEVWLGTRTCFPCWKHDDGTGSRFCKETHGASGAPTWLRVFGVGLPPVWVYESVPLERRQDHRCLFWLFW